MPRIDRQQLEPSDSAPRHDSARRATVLHPTCTSVPFLCRRLINVQASQRATTLTDPQPNRRTQPATCHTHQKALARASASGFLFYYNLLAPRLRLITPALRVQPIVAGGGRRPSRVTQCRGSLLGAPCRLSLPSNSRSRDNLSEMFDSRELHGRHGLGCKSQSFGPPDEAVLGVPTRRHRSLKELQACSTSIAVHSNASVSHVALIRLARGSDSPGHLIWNPLVPPPFIRAISRGIVKLAACLLAAVPAHPSLPHSAGAGPLVFAPMLLNTLPLMVRHLPSLFDSTVDALLIWLEPWCSASTMD
ncbi:hypothetical protein VDGL01_05169 [Verticillium dahliae]